MTENAATNAGTNGTLTVCSDGASVSLFAQLGGTPQAGGTWSGPSAVVGGNYDPATMAPGVYTYTVTGVAPCTNATATVTLTENIATNAGTNGTLTVCSDGASASLFAQLGGTPDAGGAWSGPSAVVGGNYDPATMDPGVYIYTVTGVAPCASASATVTVTENAGTNAGTNGAVTVCDGGAVVDLFAQLGGTPQAGGTWSGPSTVVGGNYDPATMDPGVYTYTVAGVSPCVSSSATVTVTENAGTNAGTNGSVTVCDGGAAVDLFAQLGGTPQVGGTWSGPSAVVGGSYDPATMAPGVYTYTVAGVAPCASASATVTVTETAGTNAGTNGSVTVCDGGTAVDLFAQLGGTPDAGGAWSGPSAVVGGNYDPATMAPGVYTYTVTGVAPCASTSATVTVTENAGTNAGTDGTVTVCDGGAAVSLFAQLGGTPQAGGTWSGPSAVVGGSYDPVTMDPGVYIYSVTGVAPCASTSATVTVTENAGTNAGTNGAVTVCDGGAVVDLFAQLGGTPQVGGTWSGSSAVVGGNYDPATMDPGVYTYTVTGVAPCASTSATVTVTENAGTNAGTDGTLTVCDGGAAVSLFAQLGGTPQAGGTWSGPSAVVGGSYDPATMDPGVYVYTVTGVAPCVDASATVTVAEEQSVNSGTSGQVALCNSSAPIDLFLELAGTPDPGGSWAGPNGSLPGGIFDPAVNISGAYFYTVAGTVCPASTSQVDVDVQTSGNAGLDNAVALCSAGGAVQMNDLLLGTPDPGGVWQDASDNPVSATFDPLVQSSGNYLYIVAGSALCPGDTATLSLTVNLAPLAGTNGSLTLCANSAATSLFDGLGGTLDAGGVWTAPDGSVHATVIDPLIDAPGDYTYTVFGSAPCADASATVAVTINPLPYAGEDAAAAYCSDGVLVSLLSVLGGAPQTQGIWTGPGGIPSNGQFAPATSTPGVYVYTVTGALPCGSDQAEVTISVTQASNAGIGSAISLCAQDDAVDLFTVLGGTPQVDGTWTGPNGAPFNGSFDPAANIPGAYTYSVAATAPCVTATAVVQVSVVPPPVANIDVVSNGSCAPATVVLSHAYTGPGSCTWILGNGTVLQDCAPVTAVYDDPGSYNVTLIIDAGNGCGADTLTIEDLVTVYAQPEADFQPLPGLVNTLYPVVFFDNLSSGAISYAWSVDGTEVGQEEDLRYTFPENLGASYDVCLFAAASANCVDSICQLISVDDGMGVFVPNSFTPNGDEINETFQPVLLGIDPRFFSFIIFDRWGLEVFNTSEPGKEWNGRNLDGTDCPVDVYVWRLITKDAYTGARIERYGHVNLVR